MIDALLIYLIIGEIVLAIAAMTIKAPKHASIGGIIIACTVFIFLWPLCLYVGIRKAARGT